MGRNQSLGSPKSIFRQILISKHVQDHFWENRNFGIFVPKNTPKPIFGTGNINFESFSSQIGRNSEKAIYEFFPKKNPSLNGYSFLIYPHFCENWPDPKKTTFSHFLQNTVLDPKRHKTHWFISRIIGFIRAKNHKKSMNADVFAFKNCLKHRPTTLLTSAHAHGPKQVSNNLF